MSPTDPVSGSADEMDLAEIGVAVARTYASLRSYQDRVTHRYRMVARNPDGTEQVTDDNFECRLSFAAPNRIHLPAKGRPIWSDGRRFWQFNKFLGQYTENWVDEVRGFFDELPPTFERPLGDHPLLALLVRGYGPPRVPFADQLSAVQAETRAGRRGRRVTGTATLRMGSAPFDFWIDDETGLLHEIRVDLTALQPDFSHEFLNWDGRPAEPTVVSAQSVATFDDIVIDADIPQARFVFTPPSGARRVEEFEYDGGERDARRELHGAPAPDFQGVDQHGHQVSLAALRGQVVVLDIWSTQMGSRDNMPPNLQAVSQRFAGRPVTFIGAYERKAGPDGRCEPLFKPGREITYPVIDDSAGVISHLFPGCSPGIVLIDREGIVRELRTGYERGIDHEAALAEAVEALLTGPAQVEIAATAAGDQVEPVPKPAPRSAAPEFHAPLIEDKSDCLIAGPEIAAPGLWRQTPRRADVDGDGRPEWILPDLVNRGVAVIAPDGSALRSVPFDGLPDNCGQVAEVHPVELDGRPHWFALLRGG